MKLLNSYFRVALAFLTLFVGMANLNAQPSGDGVVDGRLYGYPSTAGNSTAPTYINPALYTNGEYHFCNSSTAKSWETKCPSDLLFTPSAHTGGFQAFGVGLMRINAGSQWLVFCYYDYYYDDDILVGVYPVCDWYYVTGWPDQTLGIAAARIEFGTMTASAGAWGQRPFSTIAFKGNNLYTPYDGSLVCDPDIQMNLAAAPCDPSGQNVFTVEDAGYEDKILIPEFNCTPQGLFGRNNSVQEAQAGCFVYDSGWYSDLPSPYQDSSLFDGASYFVPASGSAAPDQIQEGQSYAWAAEFYQFGIEPAGGGHEIKHNAAITVEQWTPYGCPANCYFNVEQTSISPNSYLY